MLPGLGTRERQHPAGRPTGYVTRVRQASTPSRSLQPTSLASCSRLQVAVRRRLVGGGAHARVRGLPVRPAAEPGPLASGAQPGAAALLLHACTLIRGQVGGGPSACGASNKVPLMHCPEQPPIPPGQAMRSDSGTGGMHFPCINARACPPCASAGAGCRAAWCLLAGPASGWVLLVGGGAAGLLYLHLSRGVGPHASGTYSLGGEGSWGAGQRAGGSGAHSGGAPVVHLRHTVPAGAPEAVTRVLQVCLGSP